MLELDKSGNITRLADVRFDHDHLATDVPSPLLSLRINGAVLPPKRMVFERETNTIELRYEGDRSARIRVEEKESHLTFEVISLSQEEETELVIWGPYATTIAKAIGETVGVVRGETYALGLQALNPRTLGGYPWRENDCMPQLDIFESGDYSDLSEKGKRHVLYRVEAAKPEDFGSTLQAYCRNRIRERVVENWGHSAYRVPPFEDGGPVGSKIALFGCPVEEALETIGRIEREEGLPHPQIDGRWGKTVRTASAAYMILGFGEGDIDRAIDYTQRAGLRYLYHPGPFKTWGRFLLNDQFPSGRQGLRRCVDKAEAAGLMVGVHTLSNFITTNDAYVTPVPDPRLAKVGKVKLMEDVSAGQTEIPVSSPNMFRESEKSHLKTIQVGEELIRYGRLSGGEPWRLLDCVRGAFGTFASAHSSGEEAAKLADHAYKVFLTDPSLSLEVARNIAGLFNECGLRQISFDGLEGNRSTGMGNYGEVLFTQAWFEGLSEDIRSHFITDASRTSHFFWHLYSRMNWGEPWYAGFRESQTEYRLKNQAYFRRNMMPAMLGWFQMKPETSIEDIEWLLARSAAFDAGYAFVTSYEALEKNGYTERILAAIGTWEEARMAKAFSPEQKTRMEDIGREFHLEPGPEEGWTLTEVFSHKFRHELVQRQPGEPVFSTFNFANKGNEQTLGFILTAVEADLAEIRMELDSYKEVRIPAALKKGQSLKYEGGGFVVVMDSSWQVIGAVPLNSEDFLVGGGDHTLQFDCRFTPGEGAAAKLEIRLLGSPEPVAR